MLRDKGWLRPAVVGASGQVGAALCRALEEEGTPEILRTGRGLREHWLRLDLAQLQTIDQAAAILHSTAPDLILCPGAMTFVDGCEEHEAEAFRANAHGPAALAAFAYSVGVPFVFFSSDYVFDGTEAHPGPYAENAKTAPLSVYGRSKLDGERAVMQAHPEALVLRTSWVYGPDAERKNFISAISRQLRAQKEVRVPEDQISTPTFNKDLAHAALQLVRSHASGVVHATGPERMNRLQLAQAVAHFFELDAALLQGVPTSSLGQRARRPLLSGLVSQRLPALNSEVRFRPFQEGLQDMLQSQAV